MEMLCPECMGALEMVDGETARCTLDGRRYKVLFARARAAVPPPPPPAPPPPPSPDKIVTECPYCKERFRTAAEHAGKMVRCRHCQEEFQIEAVEPPPRAEAPAAAAAGLALTCARHPSMRADHTCAGCGAPICATCAFPQADGTQLCPDCVMGRRAAPAAPVAAPPPPPLVGVVCVQHPGVTAIRRCKVCNAGVCATCDFELPGGVHVCPKCAAAPQRGLSSRRKKYLAWAYVLAVWSSLGLVVLLSGVLMATVESEAELEAVGMVVSFLIFIPSIIGTALGVAAFDRRLGNPVSVWVAAIWNGIILSALVLLSIIGSFQ